MEAVQSRHYLPLLRRYFFHPPSPSENRSHLPVGPKLVGHGVIRGEIRDGYLYGRGVIDDKPSGIAHLLTFLKLHESGQALNRDLIFMATADEEAGGFFGAGWLIQNRPEIFENVGVVLNEGGVGTSTTRGGVERLIFNVEVTQKVPV